MEVRQAGPSSQWTLEPKDYAQNMSEQQNCVHYAAKGNARLELLLKFIFVL